MKYIYGLIIIIGMTSSFVYADEKETQILFTSKSLTPEAALMVAKAALADCRKKGMQVSVAIVDKGGNLQVVLRDRIAGIPTSNAALLKAKTAVAFRIPSTEFAEAVNTNSEVSGLKQLPGILAVGGGVPIEASGETIGAVGVAGAPDSKTDEECAMAGIATIQDLLEFAD
jgi:uncharacterized protein GlcG (DUF336 family)